MQLTGSHSSSLPTNPTTNTFSVTIINDQILLIRLTTELLSVFHEMSRMLRQLRDNPGEFVRLLLFRAIDVGRRDLTPTNMIGFTSAALVVGSLILLVITFDRISDRQTHAPELEDGPAERAVMVILEPTTEGITSLYPGSTGRVGMSNGNGEGSAPKPNRAGGGGSGGNRELTPPQVGKVPPPSVIPAVIPTEPPMNAPSLPAAGVDLDPVLWRDVKYPAYGDPHSQWTIRSNGPGENGGIGSKNGFGVGDGRGNGFGGGNDGNTGGGDRKIGYGGGGGAGAGGIGNDIPLRSNEVDQRVRLLSKPEPHYTEEARRNQIMGTVVLRVVFSNTGHVTHIKAVHTLPFGLTERAIAAAREIKFQPATKGGRPVSVYMQLEYNFNLY